MTDAQHGEGGQQDNDVVSDPLGRNPRMITLIVAVVLGMVIMWVLEYGI